MASAYRGPQYYSHPAGIVLLALLLLLAACSGGRTPLSDRPPGAAVPPVNLAIVTGLPPDTARDFKSSMARAADKYDVGMIEGDFEPGTFSLATTFQPAADNGAGRLDYHIELRDGDGVLADTFEGSEALNLDLAGGDPLAAVTLPVLDRVAELSARRLASRMALLGFATRVAALSTPPADLFVEARPGARFEIDMETLNGPSPIEPAGEAPLPGEQDVAVADTPDPVVPPPKPESEPDSGEEIRVVAVMPVEGSPGAGNRELTQAMARMLKQAGWPVVDAVRADALVVRGKVDMSKPVGENQVVALRWFVETPRGATLGDVKQSNSVLAGSLDHGWGDAAEAVAQGAASGIFEIIKSYR